MLSFFKKHPEHTKDNHFQYGWKDQGTFTVQLGPVKRPANSGLEEAILCAQQIYKNRTGQRVSLCLSGGIDSESMLQAFVKAGVDFDVYFLKFKNDLNEFDLNTNRLICDQLRIKYFTLELDVISFFECSQHLAYAKKYRCQSPQLCVHLWLMDQIDGLPVFAGNPFVQTLVSNQPFFIGLPGDLHCAYFRYLDQNKRAGVPWFFIYSPELCAAFLKTPVAREIKNAQLPPGAYSYLHKCTSYKQAGFNVQPRADKFTGFELVREHYDKIHGTANGVSFDRLFRKPLEEMNPFPKQYLQFVPKNYLD